MFCITSKALATGKNFRQGNLRKPHRRTRLGILALSLALIVCATGGQVPASNVHIPDFSVNNGGYQAVGGGITIANDSVTKPYSNDSLRITASGSVSGSVKSPLFTIVPTAEAGKAATGNNLAFWQVKYAVKNELTAGTYKVRLHILDGSTPYEIGFEHFGGTEVTVNDFVIAFRPLCAITSTHPHIRESSGSRNVELIVYLEDAEGQLWLSDVDIRTAVPGTNGFTGPEWDAFETGDGIHYVGVAASLLQPEYAPKAEGGYCSRLIMDSAHKLLRTAGFNHLRPFVYWNDVNVHYPASMHQIIIWNSDPDGGTGDYEDSLNELLAAVDNAAYYGLETMVTLRGSPDWSHPLHSNNYGHDTDPDPFANPGNPNGVGDPYYGPQYVTGPHWLYPPDDWQDYRDFVAALVTKLKGKVNVYEILSEVNVSGQDALIGGYKAYFLWMKNFYEVAKPIDPDAQMITCAMDKMLAALVADGVMDYADGAGYHLYTGDLPNMRAMVQSSGQMKHIYMSEHKDLHPDLKSTARQEVLWNGFSTSTWDYGEPSKVVTLMDYAGNRVNNDKPAGYGDRVAPIQLYDVWGINHGVFMPGDLPGVNGDRITAEVICDSQVNYGHTSTVTLRATNNSATTFHNVRLWPVGFVDNLGLDFNAVRAADMTIATFAPAQTQEITLHITPTATQFKAAGDYPIGLAIINDEGKHSLAMDSIHVISCDTTLPADFNEDCVVDLYDLQRLAENWLMNNGL